ncbi:MAG: hypothetical protein Q9166_006012 [cf. Caloplaca sp. 2 TL-2023]
MALRRTVLILSLLVAAVTSLASEPLRKKAILESQILLRRDTDPPKLYPEYNISVPIDYFHNDTLYEPHSNGTFPLRYWFDASYYRDGGPVIVLQSGETDGSGRLPFLQKGIIHQLAQATNGIGVILEHRYYGTSFPTPDLSTKNLRFLTTDQALGDMAYFAQNVVFEGLEDKNLTAPETAYFGYGGSYAGAFVAFLRVLYPDVYYGTISSSGVTEAIWDFWRYYEPVREYGPPDCISTHTRLINVVDNILRNNTRYTSQLKSAFDLEGITYNNDFAQVLSYPIGGWQGRNWDPEVNDPSFEEYCGNITYPTLINNATANATSTIHTLLNAGGYSNSTSTLTTPMLNFVNYIQKTYVFPVLDSEDGKTLDQAYSTHNTTFYAQDDLSQDWRSWPYQYCTQWGFLQTGSGVPADMLPLVSRLLTLEYNSLVCRYAFNITTPPDTDAINRYGGFNISYPRLAIIDGEEDPWRGASPHSVQAPDGGNRTSTTEEPFLLIEGAVHHWDENGLFPNETTSTLPPAPVKEVQAQEVEFVKAWLEEFRAGKPPILLKTWYEIHGNHSISAKKTHRPLVVLHGGPGIPHDYLLPLTDLAGSYSIPVIFYDQVGCGRSTHLPERKHDTELWTPELFLAELDNLLEHLGMQDIYDILGQSWGGMLGALHAIRQPAGLKNLIIANSPADMESWVAAADRLRLELPEDVQEILRRCEREGTQGSEEYEKAMMVFYERHVCRVVPLPAELEASFAWLKKDDTVYHTMNGPSEFSVTGTLKTFNIRKDVHKIKVRTLLINGRYDEAQDDVVEPFFQEIEKVKWYRFAESSHTPQLEERAEFMKVVARFSGYTKA